MEREMTIQEIEAEFDSEWVLVLEPETNEAQHVVKGRVVCHSRDRDDVYRKVVALRPKHSAILYTGKTPKDMEFML